ncbi:MAG: hypothetical protein M0Q01_09040 [Syntrophales bacterium]|jgi:hypothetical protein|nr:hypothetical protein [Syntrophales bacterium]
MSVDQNQSFTSVRPERAAVDRLDSGSRALGPESGQINDHVSVCSLSEALVISDIFNHVNESSELDEHLKVYNGVTFIRNRAKQFYGEPNFRGGMGKRGPVTSFSSKSRRNMQLRIAMIEEPLRFWQDFTFADDVMEGLSIKERAKVAAGCLRDFKQYLKRDGIDLHGVWKKEWKKRRSGRLQGQFVPHYHMVYYVKGMDQKAYLDLCIKIAVKWVEFTKTKDSSHALSVALHHKSYRFVGSLKKAAKYMSKYISKHEGFESTESIGRNWGLLGNPSIGDGNIVELTQYEMILFKRLLRKYAKRARKYFKVTLRAQYRKFFIYISRSTVIRILTWIRDSEASAMIAGVPF